jgi:hypothetical protein
MSHTTNAECLCQRCNQNYPVWYTSNELWNKYIDPYYHFLCPTCFCFLANLGGCKNTGWFIIIKPEDKIE